MSLRSLQWSLLLLLLFRFLVTWHLSLPPHHVTIVNWMYFYESIYRQDFHFTLQEHSKYSHQNPFLVILVILHPSDEKVRQAIRVTWGAKKSWWRYERSGANKICKMTRHIKSIKSEDIYVWICLNLLKVDIYIPENTNLFFLYRNHLDVYQLRCVTEAHDFSSKEIITFWQ
ncbi:hypothetical protein Celaphus_00006074, partial [Cervus elaphus hippelaphus]